TPRDEAWLSTVDQGSVPPIPIRAIGSGICKDAKCDGSDNDECFESCGNKATDDDVYGCKAANQWALTFDDGPGEHTEDLLDILQEENVKATFCVTGAQAEKYPEVVRRAYKEGHQIALHTYSHSHLMSLSNEEIIYELKATERAIVRAIGVRPRYLRPPFGEADARVKALAKAMDYKILMWNVDPRDYDVFFQEKSGKLISKHLKKVMDTKVTNLNAHNDPGFISLQHDLYEISINEVPGIIKALRNHGYDMTTVAECIGDDEPFSKEKSMFRDEYQYAGEDEEDDHKKKDKNDKKDDEHNEEDEDIESNALNGVIKQDSMPINIKEEGSDQQTKAARPLDSSDANSSDKSSSTSPTSSATAT
ncbi:uncharacterized protein BX664DRAFT_376220, partial [Halteromyces radiatus]|uniref:uncharacterized protein n=1 Tax=Halteromyces radiatus TaxID=101107 RepID=UPI00221F15D1